MRCRSGSFENGLLEQVCSAAASGSITKRLNALQIDIDLGDYSPGIGNATNLKFRTTQPVIDEIMTWAAIDSLRLSDERDVLKSPYLMSIDSSWTIYDFGPLWVPMKGMRLALNDSTLIIYGSVMEEFEKVSIEKKNNRFWVNGIPAETYTFQQDYYFMLGDNRGDSNDS